MLFIKVAGNGIQIDNKAGIIFSFYIDCKMGKASVQDQFAARS